MHFWAECHASTMTGRGLRSGEAPHRPMAVAGVASSTVVVRGCARLASGAAQSA